MGVQYYENYRKSKLFSDEEKILIEMMTQVNFAAGQAEKAVSCRHQVDCVELERWLTAEHPLFKTLPEEPTYDEYQNDRRSHDVKRKVYNEAFSKVREQMTDEMSRIATEHVRELLAEIRESLDGDFE